jgi:hypothetical protein
LFEVIYWVCQENLPLRAYLSSIGGWQAEPILQRKIGWGSAFRTFRQERTILSSAFGALVGTSKANSIEKG